MNVVIMAGGGGTRLWPLSIRENPKQFVDLGTGKSLLEHAYDRALALTRPDQIFVATSEKYRERIEALLPDVSRDRIFMEPARRDTTAAFVNVCARLQNAGKGNEVATFLWSDHVFTNERAFLEDLKRAPALLEEYPQSLLLMGHVPLNPNTTLGYFQSAEHIPGYERVHRVKSFIEKPDKDAAQAFVAAGGYFWNLGYFSLYPSYLLKKLVKVSPEYERPVKNLMAASMEKDSGAWRQAFESFPKQALEKTFVEKLDSIIAITGDYGWSDVGNWATVKEIFGTKIGQLRSGRHFHVDSENNFIYNTTDKAVSLVGLDNTVVVVTDKAVLVCDTDAAHKVKEVVERIEKDGKGEYL